MNMKRYLPSHQPLKTDGFTIIELMIATAVFSVILLIATTAVLFVTNLFVGGNNQATTQDVTRNTLSTISQDIQFNPASTVVIGPYNGRYGYYCIGNDVYAYQTNREVSGSNYHALLLVTGGTCPQSLTSGWSNYQNALNSSSTSDIFVSGVQAHELLASNLRLGEFVITPVTGTSSYQISITVAYGNNTEVTAHNNVPNPNAPGAGLYYSYTCPPEALGGQFCAVASLTTAVTSRIQ